MRVLCPAFPERKGGAPQPCRARVPQLSWLAVCECFRCRRQLCVSEAMSARVRRAARSLTCTLPLLPGQLLVLHANCGGSTLASTPSAVFPWCAFQKEKKEQGHVACCLACARLQRTPEERVACPYSSDAAGSDFSAASARRFTSNSFAATSPRPSVHAHTQATL